MSRARNIKPGFYKNEDLAECSIWARFIFPGLWMLADREGRLEDRPKRIKGELLPFDTIDVEPLLQELHDRGFLVRYQIDGGSFIQISKFKTHQTPHYSEKQSVIKPPKLQESVSDAKPEIPGELQEHSGNVSAIKRGSQPPDSLNPDSPNPDSLIPSKPAVEKIPLADGSVFDVDEDFVAEMRKAYPRVDVPAELGKMRAWCVANVAKRKSRRGVTRFVNSWLAGAAERAAAAPAPQRAAPSATDMDYLHAVGK